MKKCLKSTGSIHGCFLRTFDYSVEIGAKKLENEMSELYVMVMLSQWDFIGGLRVSKVSILVGVRREWIVTNL